MRTATKTTTSTLTELRRLEQVRDGKHAEARNAREPLQALESERRAQGLVAAPAPPKLVAERDKTVAAFHEADLAVRRFKVAHAGELFAELVPGRDVPGASIVAALEQLRAALADYRGVENQGLAALAELAVPGIDLHVDARVTELAAAIEDVEVDAITPVFSHSLETPDGWAPRYVPNESGDGWRR